MRSAASRPLSSTIGTPTPGVVPEPAKTTFSPQQVARPERAGLREGVGRGERRARAPCPRRLPVQRGRDVLDLDRVAEADVAARLERARRPRRGSAARTAPSRRRRRGSAWGTARSRPAGRPARARGRLRVGFVTRNDGSLISRPAVDHVVEHLPPGPPEVDVVVRDAGRTTRVEPASSRKHDGEYVSRRTDHGRPAEQVAVRDRQVGVEHDDVAGDPLAVGGDARRRRGAPASSTAATVGAVADLDAVLLGGRRPARAARRASRRAGSTRRRPSPCRRSPRRCASASYGDEPGVHRLEARSTRCVRGSCRYCADLGREPAEPADRGQPGQVRASAGRAASRCCGR